MNLPKSKKRRRLIIKVCIECDIEYLGHPITKYCPKHRDVRNRRKKIKVILKNDNRIIKHKEITVFIKTVKCGLYGCQNRFDLKIFPRQEVYAKYCEEHITEWKRKLFSQQRREQCMTQTRRR